MNKSTLIDSNAVMPTRRKVSNNHRERLNEMTPRTGDAIVRTYGKKNHKKSAEMADSFLSNDRMSNKLDWVSDLTFDANADATNTLGYIFADTY